MQQCDKQQATRQQYPGQRCSSRAIQQNDSATAPQYNNSTALQQQPNNGTTTARQQYNNSTTAVQRQYNSTTTAQERYYNTTSPPTTNTTRTTWLTTANTTNIPIGPPITDDHPPSLTLNGLTIADVSVQYEIQPSPSQSPP